MAKSSEFYSKQKEKAKEKANLEIARLFSVAREAFSKSKIVANRLVRKARKLAMKNKIRMPRKFKRMYCKHCYYFLVPSVNLRVRTSGNKVIYYCMECKKFSRFPYVKEKKMIKK